MSVIFIEDVYRTGGDSMNFAGNHVFHFAFAGEAVIRLIVVLVLKMQLGAFDHRCLVKRIANPISLHHEPGAVPTRAACIARRALHVRHGSHYHSMLLSQPSDNNAASMAAAICRSSVSRRALPIIIRPTPLAL